MKAKLKEKIIVAKETLKVVFELEKKVNFKAGQYAFITLTDIKIDEERGNRHHFSIVNHPQENDTITFITRLTGSKFKQALEDLKIGHQVKIDKIGGEFLLPKNKDSIVLIAGGIGITPFLSMLNDAKNRSIDKKLTLLYSNRDKESTIYFDRLKMLNQDMDNLNIIFTMTSDKEWPGENRRINSDFIKEFFPKRDNCIFMIAGPPAMVGGVSKEVKKAGVGENKILTENFIGYEKY